MQGDVVNASQRRRWIAEIKRGRKGKEADCAVAEMEPKVEFTEGEMRATTRM